ncbi:hypothetical protein MAH1_20020 [Sessilibacter sp. MAH1]
MPYYEGLAFDKFWSIPLGVLPVGLVAVLTFVVSAIASFMAVLRKRKSINHLVVIAVLPVLLVAIYKFPFPSYVDGMHKTLEDRVPRDEILRLSIEAREINLNWTNYKEHDALIERLRTKYPNALSLSHISPRIEVLDNYVSVFYGSALVKHWGYLFTESDEFPIEYIPEGMYSQVYEGVWVYHDIW